MKRFISMVMASAMMISMVPATALAATDAVVAAATINDAIDVATESDDIAITEDIPELKLRFTKADRGISETDFEITLEDAYWNVTTEAEFEQLVTLYDEEGDQYSYNVADLISNVEFSDEYKTVDFTVHRDAVTSGYNSAWDEKDQLYIDLKVVITKTSVGSKPTLTVESNDITIKNGEDKVFATVVDRGIKASVDELVDVAPGEITGLEKHGILIEDTVKTSWKDGDVMELKLNKGFEFVPGCASSITLEPDEGTTKYPASVVIDEREMTFTLPDSGMAGQEEFEIRGIEIDAATAEVGERATISIKLEDLDKVTVDVAQVIAPRVEMEVEDDDVPVYYSGTNVDNDGLTDGDDHESLEVTIKETFAGTWDVKKNFELSLPEGVWVTNVTIEENEMYGITDEQLMDAFETAYIEGEHESFIFERRTFNETEPGSNNQAKRDPQGMTFTLTLVADPDFTGDVVLTLSGKAMDTEKVTIAKFVPPYTVEAEQNDLVIDYRYTEVPSPIIVKEPVAELWDKGTYFTFGVEKMQLEEEATYDVDSVSELEIEGYEEGRLGFTVEDESDEAATVTISGLSLYMQRDIPAGAYELTLNTTMERHYNNQRIFAVEHHDENDDCTDDCVVTVEDVNDYSDTVKEKFINVVTAGRDQDDATFTTKLMIPVGQKYMIVGEKTLTTDVAAYINMDGYTMLPVRTVAVALGIDADNLSWHEESKTVTIFYGQRVITMTVGQKSVFVSGTEIPASAAVEVIGGRAFLGMRDLATALGVTDVAWDNTTKTVTLNGAE